MIRARIIGRELTYVGSTHTWAKGLRVKIVAIHRGADPDSREILDDDERIGAIRPDDVIEFRPEITEEDGTKRWSFVTSDASPDDVAL